MMASFTRDSCCADQSDGEVVNFRMGLGRGCQKCQESLGRVRGRRPKKLFRVKNFQTKFTEFTKFTPPAPGVKPCQC